MEKDRPKQFKRKFNMLTDADVKRMKEERDDYYKELKEVQDLKDSYHQLLNAELPKETKKYDEVLSVLTSSANVHPGRKVFYPPLRYQCFNKVLLAAEKTEGVSLDTLRYLLKMKIYEPISLSKSIFRKLFKIMSIDDNFLVCASCFELLVCNVDTWTPKLKHIFQILFNWGATFDSLVLTGFEKSIVFPKKGSMIILEDCGNKPDFCNYNYEKIICYLTAVIQRKPSTFSEIQKLILIKALLRSSLDERGSAMLLFIRDLVSVYVDSLAGWNTFKVVHVSSYLHDEAEDFHNQITVVTNVLPVISKCNDIASCLSFTILNAMIRSEVKYLFPVSDTEILQLIKTIDVSVICKENLLNLYLIVYLVNYIVCHKNIAEENKVVLNDIKSTLESLKREVVRNHDTFDADLLKGRINYCSSMWSLLQ